MSQPDFEMKLDSETARSIRQMYSLQDGEQIWDVLPELCLQIKFYQVQMRAVSNALHLRPDEIAVLANQTPRVLKPEHEWLKPGMKVLSDIHGNLPGTYHAPGPMGWALCTFNGHDRLENPGRLLPYVEEQCNPPPAAAPEAPKIKSTKSTKAA